MSRFWKLYNRSLSTPVTCTQKCGIRTKQSEIPIIHDIIEPSPEKKLPAEKIPIITCRRSPYNFYVGDKYDKKKPVLASKGWNNRISKGDHFFIHPFQKAKETFKDPKLDEYDSFIDLGLDTDICKKLDSMDLREPLVIQKLAIPKILKGYNTILAAETGCGKTMAYLLPLIQQVLLWKQMTERSVNNPLALIITPTRDLATQIGIVLAKLCDGLDISTKIITGGKTKRLMIDPPVGDLDILVGSFGVISKLTTTKIYTLNYVRHVVLDEADALFHETFEEQLQVLMRRIPIGFGRDHRSNQLPKTAQLTLASATMPRRTEIVLENIANPDSFVPITTGSLHYVHTLQKFMRLIPDQKPFELLKYIKPKAKQNESVLIFSNYSATCCWVSIFLNNSGVKCEHLHGDMPKDIRRQHYINFLQGKVAVLSTTNAGARGLDTTMVKHVLNYDFPTDTADYIHRCGRTGRTGSAADSRVTTFICKPVEIEVLQKVEKAARQMKPIPIFDLATANATREKDDADVVDDSYIEKLITNTDQEDSIPY